MAECDDTTPVDLSRPLNGVGPVTITESFIRSYAYHNDRVKEEADTEHMITDSRRPRPAEHRSFIFQPYFHVEPSNYFSVEDQTPSMFYDVRQDGTLRPATGKPSQRPLSADTLETTVRTNDSAVKQDLQPRRVTTYEQGNQGLTECFNLARSTIESYVVRRIQRTNGSTKRKKIEGLIAGEPWVRRLLSTPSQASLLTPILTVYDGER